MQNYMLFRLCVAHPCSVFMDVCFVLFLFLFLSFKKKIHVGHTLGRMPDIHFGNGPGQSLGS